MTTVRSPGTVAPPGRRVAALLHRAPRLRLAGLLAPALLWLVLLYLVPLGLLLATAFFDTDSFTGRITYEFTTENVVDVLTTPAYLLTVVRTVGVAVGVTLLCVLLALPLATYTALVSRRPGLLVALVLTPLWASYLVKVYAWRMLLAPEGPLGAASPGYGWFAVVVTLTYLWLPYMVLPLHAGLTSMVAAGAVVPGGRRGPRRPAVDGVPHGRAARARARDRRRLGVHVLAEPGRLHHRPARRRHRADAGQPRLPELLHGPAVRRGRRRAAAAGDGRLPADDPAHRRPGPVVAPGELSMVLSPTARWLLRAAALGVLTFIYVPLALVLLNSFSASATFAWPPPGLTLRWWQVAASNEGVRTAVLTSVQVALLATVIAVVLGTLASIALVRYEFFGRDAVSLLVVLPIALPGIVTGIALNTLFTGFLGGLTFLTLVVGHATFCIVVVVNNASARLRRMSGTVEEASMDLGATPWTTWRLVTFPALRGALLAGALLAFALSFDEIVVTTFTAGPGLQTLPLWIFQNLFRPNQSPIVNVAAAVLVLISVLPVYLANRLSGDTAGTTAK